MVWDTIQLKQYLQCIFREGLHIGVGMNCTLGRAHSISCAIHVQYNNLSNI